MQPRSLPCTSAAFAELSEEFLHLGKSLRFRAQGASMRPLVRNGDILMVKPVDAHQVRIGDVLLCNQQAVSVVVHRVIRKRSNAKGLQFLVQGDQAVQADGWIPQDQVYGVLAAVERDGKRLTMDGLRMRILSRLAVVRSRWHLEHSKFSNHIVRWAKKLAIFNVFLS